MLLYCGVGESQKKLFAFIREKFYLRIKLSITMSLVSVLVEVSMGKVVRRERRKL